MADSPNATPAATPPLQAESAIAAAAGLARVHPPLVQTTAEPPQTPRSGMTGETIFNAIGCNACHVAEWTTANDKSLEAAIRGMAL